MSNDYQIGKDMGQVLARLDKLEKLYGDEDCGCGGSEDDGLDEDGYAELDERDLEFSYSVKPLLQGLSLVSIIVKKDDPMIELFTGGLLTNLVSFNNAESDDFLFYTATTSQEPELFDQIGAFISSKNDSMRSSKGCCTYYTQRNLWDCSNKRKHFYSCRDRQSNWNRCKDRGHSLCPRELRWYSCNSSRNHC